MRITKPFLLWRTTRTDERPLAGAVFFMVQPVRGAD